MEDIRRQHERTAGFKPVQFLTRLPFGEGVIGADTKDYTAEEIEVIVQAVNTCIKPIPKQYDNTADCVDGRRTIMFANGVPPLSVLERRVTHQLPGGLVLPVTKAAVAADLQLVRDAHNFQAAYETMFDFLSEAGYEDGGHTGCGASKLVEKSTAEQLPEDIVIATLPILRPQPENIASLWAANSETKHHRLNDGFYSEWSSTWHESFLESKVPHNFSILETQDNETSGHNEKAVVLIRQPGFGFAKNAFIDMTGGMQAFVQTMATAPKIITDIAPKITGSELETARFLFEFDDEAPHVLNQLAAAGMPLLG